MKVEYKQVPLVERIDIDLTREVEEKLTRWIDQQKTEIEDDRSEFLERQKKYLFQWDDFITQGNDGPFESASNKHMPLTSIMVKTHHARLYNIFAAEDTVQYTPREGADEVQAEIAKKLRYWYMWDYINEYEGCKSFIRELCWDTITVGFGLGMKDWMIKQRKILDIVPQEIDREMKDLEPQLNEAKDASGGETDLEGEMERENTKIDTSPYKEVQKILTVFEGTRLRTMDFEDCYFPNKIHGSADLNQPPLVLVEADMTESEIRMRGRNQGWKDDVIETIISERVTEASDSNAKSIKDLRASNTGYNDQESNYGGNEKYKMQYCFCTFDIDGDGIDEEIVVTRSGKGTIAKATFLERVSVLGVRPLIKFDCFMKPRQAYSRGVPEYMWPLNQEMDETHNMRLNALKLQTTPMGVYRSTSSLKNQPIRIAPGKFIPVDDTSDMKPFSFDVSAAVLGGEEDRIWNYAERQISTSSLQQGIVPQTVGPTRSTSGVLTLLQQMDKEAKPMIDHNADQWKKLEKMILADLDFRVDPALKMRVLGASVQDSLNTEQLSTINEGLKINASFDIKIDVASIVTSDEVRRNESQLILQMISNPSLAQQFGVVGPKALFKAWSDYLKAHGREVDQFIDQPVFTTRPLTIFQEIQYVGQGGVPPMSMQDDHMAKAQQLQAFTQTPQYEEAKVKGIFVGNVDDIMQKTIQKHSMLAQALAPKGAPNPSGGNNQDLNATLAGQAPQQKTEGNDGTRKATDGGGSKKPNPKEGVDEPGKAG